VGAEAPGKGPQTQKGPAMGEKSPKKRPQGAAKKPGLSKKKNEKNQTGIPQKGAPFPGGNPWSKGGTPQKEKAWEGLQLVNLRETSFPEVPQIAPAGRKNNSPRGQNWEAFQREKDKLGKKGVKNPPINGTN